MECKHEAGGGSGGAGSGVSSAKESERAKENARALAEDEEEDGEDEWCSGKGLDLKKGLWTAEEDATLIFCVSRFKEGNWSTIAQKSGLKRSGKSCRLRWVKHLSPNVNTGPLSEAEQARVIQLQQQHGNKWALIAQYIPGRSDNTIKNFWNSYRKRMMRRQASSLPSSAAIPAPGGGGGRGMAALMGLSTTSPLLRSCKPLECGGAAADAEPTKATEDGTLALQTDTPLLPLDSRPSSLAVLPPTPTPVQHPALQQNQHLHHQPGVGTMEMQSRQAGLQAGRTGSEEVLSFPLPACSEVLPSSPSEKATESAWRDLEGVQLGDPLSASILAVLEGDEAETARLPTPSRRVREYPARLGVQDAILDGHEGTLPLPTPALLETSQAFVLHHQHNAPPQDVLVTRNVPASGVTGAWEGGHLLQRPSSGGGSSNFATNAVQNCPAVEPCDQSPGKGILRPEDDVVLFPTVPRYRANTRPSLPSQAGHQESLAGAGVMRAMPGGLHPADQSSIPAAPPVPVPKGLAGARPVGSSTNVQVHRDGPGLPGGVGGPAGEPLTCGPHVQVANLIFDKRQRQFQEAKRLWQAILDSPKGMCAALRMSMPSTLKDASCLGLPSIPGTSTLAQKPRARSSLSPAQGPCLGTPESTGAMGSAAEAARPAAGRDALRNEQSSRSGRDAARPRGGASYGPEAERQVAWGPESHNASHCIMTNLRGAPQGQGAPTAAERGHCTPEARPPQGTRGVPEASSPSRLDLEGGTRVEAGPATGPGDSEEASCKRRETDIAEGDANPRESKRAKGSSSFRSRQPASLTITRTSLPVAAAATFSDHCRTPDTILAFRSIGSPSISALFASPRDCDTASWVWDIPLTGQGTPGTPSPPGLAH